MLVGKTNLDQFATGLVGVRSPYGVPRNPFDARYIAGGSSSGSAVAVAAGLVELRARHGHRGLGPRAGGVQQHRRPQADAAACSARPASCRPAARSTACRSSRSPSSDACRVARRRRGFDPADPLSRAEAARLDWSLAAAPRSFRFGVPARRRSSFSATRRPQRLFAAAVDRWRALGGTPVDDRLRAVRRDRARCSTTAPGSPSAWRAFRELLAKPDALLRPDPRDSGRGANASPASTSSRRAGALERLRGRRRADAGRRRLPARADHPHDLHGRRGAGAARCASTRDLGLYTNFVNLLELCGLAVPNSFRADGLPSGDHPDRSR